MSAYVVWIDHEHAKIFHLTPKGPEKKELRNKAINHHTHSKREETHGADRLFHDLIEELRSAQEVLLVGPGLAKNEFKNHLERHNHKNLAGKIVGVETMSHPTDNQILEMARKFFKTYDALH